MNTIINYVRDQNNIPIAVFIADQVEARVKIGFAVCNPKDPFNKKLGKAIAIGRANKYYDKEKINIPQRVAPNFFKFLILCLTHITFVGLEYPKWLYLGDNSTTFPGVLVDLPKSWEEK